jgi:predicted GTPase
VNYPVEWLRDINIVDTPGTNAVIRKHEQITSEFVPRADLILFVTSADRPFTESERQFIERIRDWGKKVVFVVNKIDIHEPGRPGQRTRVRQGERSRAARPGADRLRRIEPPGAAG